MSRVIVYVSDSLDARINQAIEAALFDTVGNDTIILYLWSNDNAVFIGKNQNAFLECNLDALEADGGVLRRRFTGGGAVYHDKGNLNYSFIASNNIYNEDRQFAVVLKAVQSLGIGAELSGRNDITVDGKKFSGNAFYRDKDKSLHHGTILINASYKKIAKYLSASKVKLNAKGVSSVASRVVNLEEYYENLDSHLVSNALTSAFSDEYGTYLKMDIAFDEAYKKRYAALTDKRWLLGDDVYYDARVEARFDWGTADIRLGIEKDIIIKAKIYSDALDVTLVGVKESALIGQSIHNPTSADAQEILSHLVKEA